MNLIQHFVGGELFSGSSDKKGKVLNISKADLGKALTAKVAINGKMVDNPYKKWSEINPSLPNVEIRVYGPPTTSGTRASYAEMVNEKGYCKKDDEAKAALKAAGMKAKKCRAMRTDGAFIEAGEQDNLIVQKLEANPSALGVFGYSFLEQNSDLVQGSLVNGVEPEFEEIASGNYPIARSLYFYVKKEHIGVIPGIPEFMSEFTKEDTWSTIPLTRIVYLTNLEFFKKLRSPGLE